jgi:hypothetical protein
MIEGFECQIKVRPIEDWVQDKETDKHCPPCLMKPLVEYYIGILGKGKASKQLNELEKAWEKAELLTIAKTMDKIKSEVGDDLKEELLAYDCYAQSFEE